MNEIERLTQEYNANIANNLVMKARQIGRVIDSLERKASDQAPSSPTTEAPSRDDFIRAAEERIYAARQSGDVFMATAIRVELLTMWDEGRREAVRRIRGRLFEAAWRAEDGREWLDPKVTSTILDDVDRVAGLNASESPPLRPDFCVSCEGQHDEGKHSRDASESPPTATCCGHLPHGNGPCHGMVTDWGGERIPCDCDGRDASESPRTEWRDPEGPPEPPKIVGNASESPPTLSNSGGSVTNVPSPEFHDGVRATLPTGQRHYHGDTLYDRAIECYDVHGDASESPPVHVCCEGQPRVGDASESGQPPEADR